MENIAETKTYSLFILVVGFLSSIYSCIWLEKLAIANSHYHRWINIPETQQPSRREACHLLFKIVGLTTFLAVVIPPLKSQEEALFMLNLVGVLIYKTALPILGLKDGITRMWGGFLYVFLNYLVWIVFCLTVIYNWGSIGYVTALSLNGIAYLIYLFLYNQKKHW